MCLTLKRLEVPGSLEVWWDDYILVEMGGEVWWGGGMGCGTVGGGVDKEGNKIWSVKINKN